MRSSIGPCALLRHNCCARVISGATPVAGSAAGAGTLSAETAPGRAPRHVGFYGVFLFSGIPLMDLCFS